MENKVKQVIVIRKDLKMRKGKIAAQTAHASMKVLLESSMYSKNKLEIKLTDEMEEWLKGIFTKICVSVNSEEELDEIYQKALSANLSCAMIIDSGLTEFHGVKTKTCIAIGPNYSDEIDTITGHLSLL